MTPVNPDDQMLLIKSPTADIMCVLVLKTEFPNCDPLIETSVQNTGLSLQLPRALKPAYYVKPIFTITCEPQQGSPGLGTLQMS